MNAVIDVKFDAIPLIGVMLICAGIVKQYLYYKMFKIRILSFLTIDEVLLSFADNLISYFIILIFSTVFTVGFNSIGNALSTSVVDFHTLSLFERLFLYLKEGGVLIALIFIACALVVFFGWLRPNIHRYEIFLNVALIWLSFLVLPIVLFEIQVKLQMEKPVAAYIYLMTSITSLLLYAIASAFSEAAKVKDYEYFKGSEFEMELEDISSDSEFYYVGHSKKYIFFYDAVNAWAEVFPIEAVKKFKFVR